MSDKAYRSELDSMGEVQVPADALYAAQTQRACENFPISGLPLPRSFIRALGLIKCACAQVNAGLGLLPAELAEAIQQAAFEVAEGRHDAHFPVDVFQTGSGTSSNMNANEVIATLASRKLNKPVHPNDHVNRGQSSNDVIPSCIHVAASLEIVESLLPALEHLARTIEVKAQGLQETVKTGRTHLMDAMPLTFAQAMGGWATQVRLGKARLEAALVRLTDLALGGTAVGTGINAPAEFGAKTVEALALMCNLPFKPKSNYFEALAAQDSVVEASGQLKTVACSIMKICTDLRWMNSGPLAGLGEIRLPTVQPGSSIMPGKVNPVIAEAVSMVCAQVMGNDTTITIAGQSGAFELNVMLPVMAHNLLQSIELLSSATRLLADKVIVGFEVQDEQLSAVLARNPILVTALNNVIGYERGAAIVKKAYAEQRPIIEVAAEETDIPYERLAELLDPLKLTQNSR